MCKVRGEAKRMLLGRVDEGGGEATDGGTSWWSLSSSCNLSGRVDKRSVIADSRLSEGD